MRVVAIVPAAGRGDRFGGAKLVASVGGQAMLDRTLQSLLDADVAEIVVVMPPETEITAARVARLSDRRVRVAVNADPAAGMFSTVRAGLQATTADLIVVLPGDIPFVRPATIVRLLDACESEGRSAVPTFHGRRGHPLVFPGAFREAILTSPVTETLSDVVKRLEPQGQLEVAVDDPGVLRDIDTRSDLAP
jgi:molybdenum cofactor cytidylyltransferase